MEKERVLVSNYAAEKLLDRFGDDLFGVIKSNASWEENRLAVKNQDVDWIKDNIDVGLDVIPNLSFIATTDLNGQVIQAGDVSEFSGTLANKDTLKKLETKSEFSGLTVTSKGIAAIAASKVTNEDGTAKPTGILIFGRLINNQALGEIKQTFQDDVALLTNSGTVLSTSETITEKQLKSIQTELQTIKDGKLFTTSKNQSVEFAQLSTPLKDFSGKSIGVLSVNQKQATSTQVKAELVNVSMVIFLVIILMLILLSFLINRLMIKPNKRLSGNFRRGIGWKPLD